MTEPRPLKMKDLQVIAEAVQDRLDRWENEDLTTSICVVLANFGDHLTPVQCIKGEWSGQKQDIPRREGVGVPLCPNGHVLLETGPPLRLGLIEEER